MENRRRVTEKDLLVTEALIAKSYSNLKHSVIQAPARAFRSANQIIHDHPFATAGAAVATGAAVYGIIKMMTPPASARCKEEREQSPHKDTNHPDLMHEMLLMILPMAVPYIAGYIQKYMGSIQSEESE
jgi:hypothetical protein